MDAPARGASAAAAAACPDDADRVRPGAEATRAAVYELAAMAADAVHLASVAVRNRRAVADRGLAAAPVAALVVPPLELRSELLKH